MTHTECYKTIFIDESGIGSKNINSKTNAWVTVGVCSKFEDHLNITTSLNELKTKCMRTYNKELKGTDISRNHLNPGITKQNVAEGIAKIIDDYDLKVWVTVMEWEEDMSNMPFVPSNPKKGLQAKDIAREMLLERISGYAKYYGEKLNETYQLIWDLSDVQELIDFSTVTSSYVVPYSGKKINNKIIPHILGGLSSDWAEIQIADFISNFALNYNADGHFADCDKEKSDAFKEHIYPKLVCNASGKIKGIGWKKYKRSRA